MKSNVASSGTLRARSLRKIAAPLRTPTKMIDWPRKSRAISAPISATRWAIFSRGSRTLSSGIVHHLIHDFERGRKGYRGQHGRVFSLWIEAIGGRGGGARLCTKKDISADLRTRCALFSASLEC